MTRLSAAPVCSLVAVIEYGLMFAPSICVTAYAPPAIEKTSATRATIMDGEGMNFRMIPYFPMFGEFPDRRQ